jgi:hypothetical protein
MANLGPHNPENVCDKPANFNQFSYAEVNKLLTGGHCVDDVMQLFVGYHVNNVIHILAPDSSDLVKSAT